MKRRALIIYCDNTESGILNGPIADNKNIRNYLTSNVGGEWSENEILSLNNPHGVQVKNAVKKFLNDADYTFILFSGHGFINTDENNMQYMEIIGEDISLRDIITTAERQTIIIDACRGYYSPVSLNESLEKGLGRSVMFSSDKKSTRSLFDKALLNAEKGITILFSADENESASDSDIGGAYIFSLLNTCRDWGKIKDLHNVLPLNTAHQLAIPYMKKNFITVQNPVILQEKRNNYFPLAVKLF